jgi:hypothetical protein
MRPDSRERIPRAAVRIRIVGRRLVHSRALIAAWVNLVLVGAGILAVTPLRHPVWGIALCGAFMPPVLAITVFHALHDLSGAKGSEGRLEAWLALLLSVVPVLLLGIFLLAIDPEVAHRTLPRLLWLRDS